MVAKLVKNIFQILNGLTYETILWLPDELSRLRVAFYRCRGMSLDKSVVLSPNVRIRGKVSIGPSTSIAQNCTVTGTSSITIGSDVMIAPNVVIVDFDHAIGDESTPMRLAGNVSEDVTIGNNVWIGANVTITKGTVINDNVIVAANSVVRGDLDENWIYAGVPAKRIKQRS